MLPRAGYFPTAFHAPLDCYTLIQNRPHHARASCAPRI